MRSVLLGLALFVAMIGGTAAKDRSETIAFKPGATSTTVKGRIKGDAGVAYALATGQGQTLQTLFEPSNRSCYYNVTAPSATTADHIGSTSGNEFGVSRTVAGTYTIQVYLMRSAARRGESCRYSLSIELTGAPGGVSPGVSDAMMADVCRGKAATMYGVEPRRISPAAIAPDGKGFKIEATADKGPEGIKKLRCIFKPDRTLDRIMALTPDGE
ncbi:hypothetical protein [Prosthecomicrobium sp. N25]|uniref:hypothetical protein n=1 Tax=Prosthecomicrobium sp. N25 TaxID=3129254 RepID=UPI0030778933